jgi:hypothetical protein
MALSARREDTAVIPSNVRLREPEALELEILFKHVYTFNYWTPMLLSSSYLSIYFLLLKTTQSCVYSRNGWFPSWPHPPATIRAFEFP